MVSGRRAFEGKSDLSILSAVLTATPVALHTVRQKLPTELERIVNRCLEKDPESRYASGAELHQALLACQAQMHTRETGLRAILRRPRYIVPAAILTVLMTYCYSSCSSATIENRLGNDAGSAGNLRPY